MAYIERVQTRIAKVDERLDLRRVLLVGVGVPIVAASATYLLMGSFVLGERTLLEITLGFSGFVLEIGLVGFVVGTAMPHPQLRWLLYGWLMLMVDLLVVSMATNSSDGYIRQILPAAALIAGQIGLAIIWGTLGTTRWYSRVPLTMVLGGGLLGLWSALVTGGSGRLMTEVLVIQSITLGLLAGALWISDYRLEIPQTDEATGGGPRSLQFGIKDVLIWTTVMAILLGAMRAADMLRWESLQARPSLFLQSTVAALTAIAIVFAVWAALGKGNWLIRYALLTFVLDSGRRLALSAGMPTSIFRWGDSRIKAMTGRSTSGSKLAGGGSPGCSFPADCWRHRCSFSEQSAIGW